jgi:hypothetical protein
MAAFKCLVIFDYSGTLSLGAVRFGQEDLLLQALNNSGLATLGVTDTDTFWSSVVSPGWHKGSTTSSGYKKVMADAIMALAYHREREIDQTMLRTAASRFVDSYMASSSIASPWQQILLRISSDPSMAFVIATDHYAEVTPTIISFLKNLGIRAITAKEAFDHPWMGTCIVANSADLGCHKATAPFWTALRAHLGLTDVHMILLVDDFGANEQAGDSYAQEEQVWKRQKDTEAMLRQIFRVKVSVVPFIIPTPERQAFLSGQDDAHRAVANIIRQASKTVLRILYPDDIHEP